MPKKRSSFDFEKSLHELEEIVEVMEKGEFGLEESLARFERGIALVRNCRKALTEAEQKIRILLEKDGKSELLPFKPDGDPE